MAPTLADLEREDFERNQQKREIIELGLRNAVSYYEEQLRFENCSISDRRISEMVDDAESMNFQVQSTMKKLSTRPSCTSCGPGMNLSPGTTAKLTAAEAAVRRIECCILSTCNTSIQSYEGFGRCYHRAMKELLTSYDKDVAINSKSSMKAQNMLPGKDVSETVKSAMKDLLSRAVRHIAVEYFRQYVEERKPAPYSVPQSKPLVKEQNEMIHDGLSSAPTEKEEESLKDRRRRRKREREAAPLMKTSHRAQSLRQLMAEERLKEEMAKEKSS